MPKSTVPQVLASYKSAVEPQRRSALSRHPRPAAPAQEVPHAL
jgi:hypothetical protein